MISYNYVFSDDKIRVIESNLRKSLITEAYCQAKEIIPNSEIKIKDIFYHCNENNSLRFENDFCMKSSIIESDSINNDYVMSDILDIIDSLICEEMAPEQIFTDEIVVEFDFDLV